MEDLMHSTLRLAAVAALVIAPASALAWTFPDSHDAVPRNWQGMTFRLSQDYPPADPSIATPPTPSSYPWLAIDYRVQPAAYVKAIYDYVLEDNREVDWIIQNNRA